MTTKNTVRLHCVLAAKPEKVYRAFVEPDAMARWLPPNGYTGKMHHMDAKVGGTLQNVLHELHHGHEQLIWWGIP